MYSKVNKKVNYEFSVIMPCLNEERTVGTCINKVKSSFKTFGAKYQIIVADNGSIDNSKKIAKKLGAQVVEVEKRGYGAALHAGIEKATGKFIIMGDSDDSYDFSKLEPFFVKLREGNNLVMGNRFKGGILPGAMPFLHRVFGNPFFSLIGKIFFGSKVGDFYCGLRGFSKKAWEKMDLQTTGMEYAIEMVVKANSLKMKIAEIPVVLHKDGRLGRPHLKTWQDGWRTLRFMLLFAPTWLFLLPGIALSMLGGVLFILASFKFMFFGVILDAHTLLVSTSFMIVGVQSVFLGLFSKVFIYKFKLLPTRDDRPPFLAQINLNKMIPLSILLVILGVIILLKAFSIWYQQGFGNLDYSSTMRIVIPSVFLIQLGVQLFFNSFFLEVLLLPRKT